MNIPLLINKLCFISSGPDLKEQIMTFGRVYQLSAIPNQMPKYLILPHAVNDVYFNV